MPEHHFDIPDGPKLGGEPQTRVTLCSLSGVAYCECLEHAEKALQVPVGYDDEGKVVTELRLIPSPAKMSLLVLRKRITRIGEIPGPITDEVWNKLSMPDINEMLKESEAFDEALAEAARAMGEPQSGEQISSENV